MNENRNSLVRILAILLISCSLALMPAAAQADDLEQSLRELHSGVEGPADAVLRVAQKGGGKSLSEAVEQVRRQTKGRILSAQTKMNGNREVHHIKVLTKDGKVRTVKVPGRNRG